MLHRDPRGIPTREEELELIRRAQGGDTERERADAAGELVLRHYGFLRRQVARSSREGRDVKDLESVATLAFYDAIGKFEEAKGVRLTTYAGWWIRRAIQDYFEREPVVRLPRYLIWLLAKYGDAREIRHGDYIVDPAHVAAAREAMREPHSLRPLKAMKDDRGDYDPVDRRRRPEEEVGIADEVDAMLGYVEQLEPREREILCRLYGLGGRPKEHLGPIGESFGICKEWVRQIADRAIAKIRHAMKGYPVTLSDGHKTLHRKAVG